MYEIVAVASPLLTASVAVPLPTADPVASLTWLHVWLPATGLLGMGLRDVLGGDGSDGSDDAEADPLGRDFGAGVSADGDGFDDGLDDGFDDGLGADFDEVEPRLDDLEADLEELSNTVSSVHSDNEAVRESLGEIEDNVRKLLEVYEVVTQGANPFADEPAALGGSAGETSSFGLFEEDDEAGTDDAVDPEELFDDGPVEDELAEAIDDESGLTFDDLKSEFEFVGDEAPEGLDGEEGPPDVDPRDGPDASDPAPGSQAPGKPYLRALPGGFGAELLVMEWLDYLVSESSVVEAMRAVRYYGTVEWISQEVAAHLQTVLSGTSPRRELAATDGGRPSELSVDHHTESLEYVSQLRALHEGAAPLRESPGHRVGEYGHPEEDHGVQR